MKISMPSLKVDLAVSDIQIRNGKPVIVSRMGVYEATAEPTREDVRAVLRCLLRPSVIVALARLAFGPKV
jgi:hypothetical protein